MGEKDERLLTDEVPSASSLCFTLLFYFPNTASTMDAFVVLAKINRKIGDDFSLSFAMFLGFCSHTPRCTKGADFANGDTEKGDLRCNSLCNACS